MTGIGTAMDVKLAAALAGAVRSGEVAAFCRDHGISRQTFYKWRRRYQSEGLAGLEQRSRRPSSSPSKTAVSIEDRIVQVRKELADFGADHGPWSIRQQMLADGTEHVPSESTLWRILSARGLIVPEPRKRPRRSFHRFVYPRPNDCWQIDATHYQLGTGLTVEIINIIDDHSRVCVVSSAVSTCTSPAAWAALERAGSDWGLPARVLSDNGLAFNASRRQHKGVLFETNLRAAGILPIVSTPYHPQTCGKVERFHQTLKNWLDHQPQPPATITELQHALDTFIDHYNFNRPHRSLNGTIPATRWAAQPCATPANQPITATHKVERNVTVNTTGHIHIGYHRINIGVDYEGLTVTAIINGLDCIIFHNNQLIRALHINPNTYDQPSGRPTGGKPHPRLKDSP
ncbi:MAG TPA: IS481 family transposase [Ilumatobacteraceae bacterium]|jgi:transposase InsO family protein